LKLILLTVLLSAIAARAAEPASVEQVRAELDRQLQEMVTSSLPELELVFEGLDPSEYKLVEVRFTLDGEPLEVPSVDVLGATRGPHVLATRQLKEGSHTLVSNVVFMDGSWSLFSETSGFLWNMTSTFTFQAQRGLRMRVKAQSTLVPEAKDARLKIKLSHDVAVEMTTALADSTSTEPPPKRSETPDAGVVIARATPPPVEPAKPPVESAKPPVEPTKPPVEPQNARLLVRATMNRKPVAATLFVMGGPTPQQVALKKAPAPAQVEMAPGDYTVDILAPGFLAQTRRLQLAAGKELPLDFALVRAPKKKLVKEKEGRIELVKPLTFLEGRTVPLPGSTPFLQELVDMLVRDPTRRLRIEGHTDNKEGDEQSRQQISESRARALAELLVQAGLDPARIEAVGLGDTRPKAPNLTPRGRDLNRRVEFLLIQP
jgi:outer membrane protein OmpA-like peptidoglycan-associated protein